MLDELKEGKCFKEIELEQKWLNLQFCYLVNWVLPFDTVLPINPVSFTICSSQFLSRLYNNSHLKHKRLK